MANQIIGRVFYIGDTNSIKSKDGSKTYYKRELVLDATRFDGLTGQRGYDNFPSIEFSGDNCQLLDQLKMGDVVAVSFDLQGTKYEKDGQTRFSRLFVGTRLNQSRCISLHSRRHYNRLFNNHIIHRRKIIHHSNDI